MVSVDLADLLAPDSPVVGLAETFRARDHELYLVGGVVRDTFLGRRHETPDLDLSTDATPTEVKEMVEPFATALWLQGIEFGTVGAEVDGVRLEITTFRTERYQPSSRHPEVTFTADVKTDLSRRDFTINAIAVSLPDRAPIDPFGGVADLRARLIRTPIDPEDSFEDDPLRMLRAFRFASQLDFKIEAATVDAIERLNGQIRTVSAERIRDELEKLVIGKAPAHALELAEASGLTQHFLPELSSLKLEQDPVHKHKDVFHHTLAVMERTDPVVELRLAALLHDIGKPKTRRIDKDGVSFHHHEIVGADMAAARLRELRFDNHTTDKIAELIRLHHRFHTYRLGWSDSAVRRYVRDAGPLLGTLNDLVRADCTTRNRDKARRLAERMDELESRITELAAREELSNIRPDLDGNEVMAHLGIAPGPAVGEVLDYLLELRLEEGPLGKDEAYRRLDEWARAKGIS
ncbi:MAG: CCA tRNA nucleotidyltransferase [Actinomycetota bacterium]